MNRRCFVFALEVSLLLASLEAVAGPPAASQEHAVAPQSLLSHLRPSENAAKGEWAEYALLVDGKPRLSATFRVLFVEDPLEPEVTWLEMWLDKTGRNAVRVRVSGDEAGPSMLLKLGPAVFDMPPQLEPPDGQCGSESSQCRPASAKEALAAAQEPGFGTLIPIKVVAGTFRCRRTIKGAGARRVVAFDSDEAPVLRLVKAVYPGGQGFELVASGRDGRSAFPARFGVRPFPFADPAGPKALLPGLPAFERKAERTAEAAH
jgi:hypothetical protein